MEPTPYHIPALLPEALKALDVKPDGIYVDVTYGGGGHSRAIIERLESGHHYAIDRDRDALADATESDVFTPIHGNFRYLLNYMRYHGVAGKVDGILADLGVSFHHFDVASRGFSFRADGPLDMRMNREGGFTAADYLATVSTADLTGVLSRFGELRKAGRIAAAIAKARAVKPIATTQELVNIVTPLLSPANYKQELAQVFQALRIVVNGEMDALTELLRASLKVLRPGGRLAVITYHSIEDRMVKNFMRTGDPNSSEPVKDIYGRAEVPFKILTNKPIVPTAEEIERNPRCRSAKLRVAELLHSPSK